MSITKKYKNILVSADKHLGLKIGDLDRTPDIVKNYRKVISYLAKNKDTIDAYVDLGDYFHNEKPNPEIYKIGIDLLYEIDDIGVESFLLKGNHCGLKHGKTSLEPLKSIRFNNLRIIDDVTIISNLIFVPYMSKSDVAHSRRSEIEFVENDPNLKYEKKRKMIENMLEPQTYINRRIKEECLTNKIEYAFCHLNCEGAEIPKTEYKIKQTSLSIPKYFFEKDTLKLVLNGHIHAHQKIGKGLCLGSIERGSFSEINDDKFCVLIQSDDDGN